MITVRDYQPPIYFRNTFDEYKEKLPTYFSESPQLWTFHPNVVFERFNSFRERICNIQVSRESYLKKIVKEHHTFCSKN